MLDVIKPSECKELYILTELRTETVHACVYTDPLSFTYKCA